MTAWRKYPVIYEINTWVWLGELGRKHRKPVTLATVPDEEWDAIGAYGFDAVWLMGVWERSPAGIAISMRNEGLLTDFRRALLILRRRTMSARPIACAATSWISPWADRKGWQPPERSSPDGVCA